MIGVYLAMSLRYGWSKSANLLFAVGLCGGFTTFSAYSAEVVRLLEQRQLVPAAGYFLATNILCIVACFAGMQVTRWIATR